MVLKNVCLKLVREFFWGTVALQYLPSPYLKQKSLAESGLCWVQFYLTVMVPLHFLLPQVHFIEKPLSDSFL